MSDKPAPFTRYQVCMNCQGTGKNTYQGIKRPCTWCMGKGKLPMMDAGGQWVKR